jgi:hypothetical protein
MMASGLMDEKQAEWRDFLKEDERQEWAVAKTARDEEAERFRVINRTLKSRCLARMMREARRLENLTMNAKDKAVLLEGIRVLCGYVENGTDSVVKIFQDDATKCWRVRVGNREYHGASFESAIAEAVEDNTTIEERMAIAKAII